MEARPMSKLKHWRLVRIVKKAPTQAAAPSELAQPQV
jgi:hypothetical protein